MEESNISLPKFVGAVNRTVDCSCEENLVSTKLVELLGLKMEWYTYPDQIEWFKNGEEITCVGVQISTVIR